MGLDVSGSSIVESPPDPPNCKHCTDTASNECCLALWCFGTVASGLNRRIRAEQAICFNEILIRNYE